jgi:D-aminoacyl-tRNA deacylase
MLPEMTGEKMRAVATRVSSASVSIGGTECAHIERGFLVLLGISPYDTADTAERLAAKICRTRVFEDENHKMNLSLEQVGGELLVVSQFTLYADLKSRRPGFSKAADAEIALPLYEKFVDDCRKLGFTVKTGEFGADMAVSSVNDGPVTLIFDTDII